MSELNGRATSPREDPHDDFHAAADLLYEAMAGHAWFAGMERDEPSSTLIVDVKDVPLASAWLQGKGVDGLTVVVRKKKAMVS